MSLARPEITSATARHIVQRMGETGQPPERGALAVNVGTDEYLEVLRTEYLVPIAQTGRNSSFKLVQAPFGGGKTQFLHCLREVGWELGFPSALVGVSPKECPFDDPVKIYSEVSRKLELPPGGPDEEPAPGIDITVRQIAPQRLEAFGEEAVRQMLDPGVARPSADSGPSLGVGVRSGLTWVGLWFAPDSGARGVADVQALVTAPKLNDRRQGILDGDRLGPGGDVACRIGRGPGSLEGVIRRRKLAGGFFGQRNRKWAIKIVSGGSPRRLRNRMRLGRRVDRDSGQDRGPGILEGPRLGGGGHRFHAGQ